MSKSELEVWRWQRWYYRQKLLRTLDEALELAKTYNAINRNIEDAEAST